MRTRSMAVHPACLDRLVQEARSGSILFAYGTKPTRRTTDEFDAKFLSVLLTRGARELVWAAFRALVEPEHLEVETERLIDFTLGYLAHAKGTESFRKRHGVVWTAKYAQAAANDVTVGSKRLARAIDRHLWLRQVSSFAYWDDWWNEEDFAAALHKHYDGPIADALVRAMSHALHETAPTMRQLLDTLAREAESMELDHRAETIGNLHRASRPGAWLTMFRHDVCKYLAMRFRNANIAPLASIATGLTGALDAQAAGQGVGAARKQLERMGLRSGRMRTKVGPDTSKNAK